VNVKCVVRIKVCTVPLRVRYQSGGLALGGIGYQWPTWKYLDWPVEK